MVEDGSLDKEIVMNFIWGFIIVGVTISLIFFMNVQISSAPFEREFLSKDLALLEGAALSVDNLEVEVPMGGLYADKYGFLEGETCRVNFLVDGEDNPYTSYYCIRDSNKQINSGEINCVNKLNFKLENDQFFVYGEEGVC